MLSNVSFVTAKLRTNKIGFLAGWNRRNRTYLNKIIFLELNIFDNLEDVPPIINAMDNKWEFASWEIQLEQAVLQLLVDVITSQRGVYMYMYTAMQLKVNTSGLHAYCTGVGTSCSIKDIFFPSFFFSSYKLLQLIVRAKRGAGWLCLFPFFLSPLIQQFLQF